MSEALEVGEDGKSRRVERKGRREGPTPEEALAAVKDTLGKRAETAEATATAAVKDRNSMAATALASVETQLNERESRIASDITTAETAIAAAKTAFKTARAAGDEDAEMSANEALANATADLKIAKINKTNFDAQKPTLLAKAKEAAEPVVVASSNALADQWMASRPRFNKDKDPAYFNAAMVAHHDAKAARIQVGSQAYLDYIDGKLAAQFGSDHMHEPDGAHRTPRTERRGDDTSSAAPVSREADSNFSSAKHNLRLGQDAEGKTTITGTIPKEWVEAAGWTGMTPAAYAIAQLEIEREGAAGNSGYSVNGQTAVYR